MPRKFYHHSSYLAAVVAFLLGACATRAPLPRMISQNQMELMQGATIHKTVGRKALIATFVHPELNSKIRLVQTYQKSDEAPGNEPRYRLFDIRSGSAYELVGLENGDLLLGVNGRLVFNPAKFPVFIQLLAQEQRASIQLVRAEKPMNLSLYVTD